jgi:hypothetical protein
MPVGYYHSEQKLRSLLPLKTKIALEFESDSFFVFSDETLDEILTP